MRVFIYERIIFPHQEYYSSLIRIFSPLENESDEDDDYSPLRESFTL